MLNVPDSTQIAGLIGVLAVMGMFYGLAPWVRIDVPSGVRITAGWGVATVVVLLSGVGTNLPLSWIFAALLVTAGAGMILRRRRAADGASALRLLALALPMALAVSAMSASQWDEFTNWLPNQRFLAEFDRFPQASLPPSLSVFPAYPFGLPLVGHFAGILARSFVENAGAVFNTLLIAVLASLLASQICYGMAPDREAKPSWGQLALGVLAATILNPTFVPKLVFTTYVDFTTAVTLAVMGWLVWRLVEAIVSDAPVDEARTLSLLGGLTFAALVNLKQPNLVLGILVISGGGFCCLIDRRPPFALAAGLLLRLLLPPLVVFALWRYHVSTQLVAGEFSFRPLADWIWGDAAVVALQMMLVAGKKGGHFAVMIVTTMIAFAGLARIRTPLVRLAVVVAVPFWGWNAFLFASYLGSFDHGEARAVASYWRYNTQLGGLGMLVAVYAVALLWRRYMRWQPHRALAAAVCALVIAAPVLAQRAISFDRVPPKDFVRLAAREIARLVPQNSIVGTLDPNDNGEYMVFLRYALYRVGTVRLIGGIDWSSAASIGRALENGTLTHLWVRGPGGPVAEALQVPLRADATYLLERTSAGWRIVKEWATTA